MNLSEFDFELPSDLIAQEPAAKRADSRMLLLNRSKGVIRDSSFKSFEDQLMPGDVLVLNNTQVFPARLNGITNTGANVEVFLVDALGNDRWEVLAKPAKRLAAGKVIRFGERLSATSVKRLENGRLVLEFSFDGDFDEIVDEIGSTPLPPYIKRNSASQEDRKRYQTVYAKERGAIAAPTAGLHFDDELLGRLQKKDIEVCELTLHVGYGTFEPVKSEDVSDHSVSKERFDISESTAKVLNAAKDDGRKIVAVGTTSTRALESAITENGFKTGAQETGLTIIPGYEFRVVDALLTNFHLPQSSLLLLVSAFAGYELAMDAYTHAVSERYRFYSYGDCMFIS